MGGGGDDDDEAAKKSATDANIEIWKIKKLIRSLEAARGWAAHQNEGLLQRALFPVLATRTSCPRQ